MPPKPKTTDPSPPDAEARLDKDLITRAYRKTLDGQELTGPERAAVKRYEKGKRERNAWDCYNAIPQKHWRQMSGRQTKVLNEQAARYGIPFGGATINLPAVVRALHDFLAENAVKLARDEDPLLQGGPASPALEAYRVERAALAKLDRMERERLLVPRDDVRQALGRIAAILRGAGDTLQRQCGPAAVEILFEALDDAQREMDRSFGDRNASDDDATPDAQ